MHAEVRCRSTASEACTRAHCSYRARIIQELCARRLIFVMFGFNWFRCWAHKRIESLRLVCTHMHTVITDMCSRLCTQSQAVCTAQCMQQRRAHAAQRIVTHCRQHCNAS